MPLLTSRMGESKCLYKLLALLTIFQLSSAQLISSLPSCIQDCVTSSPDNNCDITDIGCICRASRGNFLPDVITCMHSTCDGNLDVNLLLTPLQLACQIAGAPIPSAALRNAENEASSLATQVTTTVTVGGSSATATSQQTITPDAQDPPSVSSVTVTSTQSGSTVYVVYPITLGSTKTESEMPSTLTIQQTFTSLIPVVIIGSSYTSTTTRVLALSTLTTTNSEGSTVTKTSTYTETTTTTARASGSSNPAGSVTTITETASGSSVAAQETTSSGKESGSKTSSASSSKKTGSPDSAPFTDTNNARSLGKREEARLAVLALLTGFMTMVMVWA
jgi:hypothetical protein